MDMNLGDTQLILAECKRQRVSLKQAAYILATARWETNHTMKPVREAYWLSEAWRKANLRYYPWYGRGYVQLTWKDNYKKAGAKLGIDLTTDADVAMKPAVAAKVLVTGMMQGWFTKRRLPEYVSEGVEPDFKERTDYLGARRVVNGTDKAKEIAGWAIRYQKALEAVGYTPSPGLTAGPIAGIVAAIAALGATIANWLGWL